MLPIEEDDLKYELIKDFTKIKAKGIFNLEDMYVELFYWFRHYGYRWMEQEYRHLNWPGGGYRLEVIWHGFKSWDDYHKTHLKLVLAADVKNVEVTLEDGKKVERQKATFEFRTQDEFIRKQSLFKRRPFGKIQLKLYEILIRKRTEKFEVDSFMEAQKLYDELRAFMMLYKH